MAPLEPDPIESKNLAGEDFLSQLERDYEKNRTEMLARDLQRREAHEREEGLWEGVLTAIFNAFGFG